MKDLQSVVKCRGWNSFDVPFSTFSLEDSSGVEPMGFSQVPGGGETSPPHDGFYLPVQRLPCRYDPFWTHFPSFLILVFLFP